MLESAVTYYKSRLAVPAAFLIDNNIVSDSNYRQLAYRGALSVIRRACRNTPALVDYENMPETLKMEVRKIVPNPMRAAQRNAVEDLIEHNAAYSDLSKVLFIFLLIIFAAAVIYLINYVINSRRFKYFRHSGANAAVIKMLNYILNFLKRCGFVMYNEESLKAFSKRISPSFAMMNPDGWEKIMDIMQKARYSSHTISEEERTYVYDFISYLRKECLKKLKFDLKLKLRFVYFVL